MAWNDENLNPSVTQETDAALVSLGQRGAVYLNTDGDQPGGTITGNFAAIQIITDALIFSLNVPGETTAANSGSFDYRDLCDDLTSTTTPTLPAGTIIYGAFTTVTLTSGSAIVYRA